MDLQIVNPCDIPDWDALLLRSGDHDFFHTSAWARVLQASYGFRPVYHAAFEGDRIAFLMPFMEVRSLVSGRRGVSLPFTDQCPPHNLSPESRQEALEHVIAQGERNRWRYVEWRDGRYFDESVPVWEAFLVHEIDLAKPEQALFASLNDNNRRNIRKGQKEGVSVSVDRSPQAIREFYRLNLITRKRHGLPPQPFGFFENVSTHILSQDKGNVVLASHGGKVIAASVFFHSGTRALYKYGASDLQNQSLRPNNLVMWEALRWYRDRGFRTMNLGRTELANPGLLQFKRTWGGREETIRYYRYDLGKKAYSQKPAGRMDRFEKIFARTPTPVLRVLGAILYKHVG